MKEILPLMTLTTLMGTIQNLPLRSAVYQFETGTLTLCHPERSATRISFVDG
jgi:hypothetical protein